jgi:alpha-L-rhamnosidase
MNKYLLISAFTVGLSGAAAAEQIFYGVVTYKGGKIAKCDNSVFGDPLPGRKKKCYYSNGKTFMEADEGQSIFKAKGGVLYGLGVFKNVSRGVACSNAVFGDPVPGVKKICYRQDGSNINEGGTIN